MNTEYMTLQAMMKLYLLQEHEPSAWLTTSMENYQYFKEYALQNSKAATSPLPPAPKKIIKEEIEKPPEQPKSLPLAPQKSQPKAALPPASLKPFELNPLGVAVSLDFSHIRKKFIENFPEHGVLDKIPEIKNSEKKIEAIVIAFSNLPEHTTFLGNLTKAIHDSLCAARMIQANELEYEDVKKTIFQSSALRILVVPEKESLQNGSLSEKINELREKNVHIIFLSPIETYLSNPKLKVALWKSLKEASKN